MRKRRVRFFWTYSDKISNIIDFRLKKSFLKKISDTISKFGGGKKKKSVQVVKFFLAWSLLNHTIATVSLKPTNIKLLPNALYFVLFHPKTWQRFFFSYTKKSLWNIKRGKRVKKKKVPNALVPIQTATKSANSGLKIEGKKKYLLLIEGRKIFPSDKSILFLGLYISCREMKPPVHPRAETNPAGVSDPSSKILVCWGGCLGTNRISWRPQSEGTSLL